MTLQEPNPGEEAIATDCQVIPLNGLDLLADPSGALIWPERKLLLAADLHFEKGSSYATQGRYLPPYDTAATLDRLEAVLQRQSIQQVSGRTVSPM